MAGLCNCCTSPIGLASSAHRSLGAPLPQSRLYKHSRPALYNQATSTGRDTSESKKDNKDDQFPQFEDSSNDLGEFLPKREPGAFPNIAVRHRCFRPPNGAFRCPSNHTTLKAVPCMLPFHKDAKVSLERHDCRLSSFVGRIADDHFVGADEKFAVKTAGIKEFDPLRDGPLRYLGYSNECGYAPGSTIYARLHRKFPRRCATRPSALNDSMLPHREAFAAWLPFWGVPFSYAVAISYVLVDTADKGVKAYQLARSELDANAALHSEVDTPRCKAQQKGLL